MTYRKPRQSDFGDARALIFDVDGTLYRLGPVRRRMLGRLLREIIQRPQEGLKTVRMLRSYRRAHEALRDATGADANLTGTDLEDAQRQLAGEACGSSAVEVGQAVSRWMEEAPLDLLRRHSRQGLRELLSEARRRNVRMAVVSDYPARRKLEALGLGKYFDEVICAQDAEVQSFKPDPRGLQLALQRLGVRASEAIYVGDRPEVDGICAERAGTRCVLVGPVPARKRTGSWDQVTDFRELADLLWPAADRESSIGEGITIA